jgi:hypothetical protein
MRLWSLHPKYLDSKGLVALWREALLAQKVLEGKTKGYRKHPQLERFKGSPDPIASIGTYLVSIVAEADKRGYNFDNGKIVASRGGATIAVTSGQIDFERRHLVNKLEVRDPGRVECLRATLKVLLHPMFFIVEGDVESWERT